MAALLLMAVAGVSIGLAASDTPSDEPRRAVAGPDMPSPQQGKAASRESLQAVEKTKDEPLVFRGQVLDPDGKPVAGATLLLGLPVRRTPVCYQLLSHWEPAARTAVSRSRSLARGSTEWAGRFSCPP